MTRPSGELVCHFTRYLANGKVLVAKSGLLSLLGTVPVVHPLKITWHHMAFCHILSGICLKRHSAVSKETYDFPKGEG